MYSLKNRYHTLRVYWIITSVQCLANHKHEAWEALTTPDPVISFRLIWELSETYILLLSSCQVVSDSLRPHGQQHTRLPCPLLSLWLCSNSCPLSQWCISLSLCVYVYICICVCIYIYVYAAAKSLQSCPTLCNPIDSSLSGSPVPGIL